MQVYLFELSTPPKETIDLIAGPYLRRVQFSDEDRKHINNNKPYLLNWFHRLGITSNDIIALYTDPNHTTTIKGEDGTCYAFIDAVKEYTGGECPIVRINPKDMSDSVPSQIAAKQDLHAEQFVTHLKIQRYLAFARGHMLLKLFQDASQKRVMKFSDGEDFVTSDDNSSGVQFAGDKAKPASAAEVHQSTNRGPVLRSVNDNKHQSKFPWFSTFVIALSLVAIVSAAYNLKIRYFENDRVRIKQEHEEKLQQIQAEIQTLIEQKIVLENSILSRKKQIKVELERSLQEARDKVLVAIDADMEISHNVGVIAR